MASSTTMNGWIEKLAQLLIPDTSRSLRTRKHLDNFVRSIRHHNYARTNQFEVQERLFGLEEKFQIMDRDDLSDAIHKRTTELDQHFERWIPDVLDLLLRLSKSPVTYSNVERISGVNVRTATPPPLKWSDVEGNDPINRLDRIWKQPAFAYFSSDEDELETVSTDASYVEIRHNEFEDNLPMHRETIILRPNESLANDFAKTLLKLESNFAVRMTEIQAIKEFLVTCQGFPTTRVNQMAGTFTPHLDHRMTSVNNFALSAVLHNAEEDARCLTRLRKWVTQTQDSPFMRVLRDRVVMAVNEFDKWLSKCHQYTIDAIDNGGVTSLLRTARDVHGQRSLLLTIQEFLETVAGQDDVAHMEVLHDIVCQAELVGTDEHVALLDMFVATFQVYASSLDHWMRSGTIPSEKSNRFIQRNVSEVDKAQIWQKWFLCLGNGSDRCPRFLQEFSELIFNAGKTVTFLQLLGVSDQDASTQKTSPLLVEAVKMACSRPKHQLLPFGPTFTTCLKGLLFEHIRETSKVLQLVLQNNCGLDKTLDAFEVLYLSADGSIASYIDTKLFKRINEGIDDWHDRYFVLDLLREAYQGAESVDCERLHIQSSRNQPPSLDGRLSVNLLGDLTIEYVIPWTISNVISQASLTVYKQLALWLRQLRWAKFEVESCTFSHKVGTNSRPDAVHVLAWQGLRFSLLCFVSTIYDHLMCCVIQPRTEDMRISLNGTLDEMISTHLSYIQRLSFSCLLDERLSVLKDPIVSVLDMCINLRSSHARFLAVGMLQAEFEKHVRFLLAGLQGLASSSGKGATEMSLLADRLDSLGFKLTTEKA